MKKMKKMWAIMLVVMMTVLLAGNVMEYTDGWVEDRGYYSAGGYYDVIGQYEPYILRLIGVTPLEKIGFRMVLYNK